MKLKKRLDELQEKLDVKTWLPDYKFNKWFFRGALIVLVLLAVVAWALLGFGNPAKNYVYLSCPDDSWSCENPFYNLCNVNGSLYYEQNNICQDINSSFYEREFLLAGQELGEKPDSLAGFIINNAWLVVLFAFLLNHFLYNKGYFKKLNLEGIEK